MALYDAVRRIATVDVPYYTGLHSLMRCLAKDKVVILMYHGFTDTDAHGRNGNYQGKHLHIDNFRSHLEYLSKNCSVISIDKYLAYRTGRLGLPAHPVIITIDDGYQSNYRLAYPLLARFGFPAAIFLTTDFIDEKLPLWVDRLEYAIARTQEKVVVLPIGGAMRVFDLRTDALKRSSERAIRERLKEMPFAAREELLGIAEEGLKKRLSIDGSEPDIYRPLSWQQIKEMAAGGLVSVGSHGRRHVIVTVCDPAEMKEELSLSKRLIEEKAGVACASFCYPNGGRDDFDERTKNALRECGYSCGFVNVPGFNGDESDVFELRRFGLGKRPDAKEFAVTVSGAAGLAGMAKYALQDKMAQKDRSQKDHVVDKFDRCAGRYSETYTGRSSVAHSFRIRRQRVEEILSGIKGGRMLDVGCGPGVMVDYALEHGFEFYGVDISPAMIDQCRTKFNYVKDARFFVGRIEELEFHDSFFDVVICMGVAEYIDNDDIAVSQMARVLKPGGVAIITLPNRRSPYRVWHKVMCNRRLCDALKILLRRRDATLTHREYVEEEYGSLLASYGLKIEDVIYYNFNLFLFPLDKLFPFLAAYISEKLEVLARSRVRWLGTGFIVAARKNG